MGDMALGRLDSLLRGIDHRVSIGEDRRDELVRKRYQKGVMKF